MAISWQAIYVLWLREMKGMWRAKSRVVGALGMPVFFLPPEIDIYSRFISKIYRYQKSN
jgi:hypothetical protein